MKFPLFSRRPDSPIVPKGAQDDLEKFLADSFRLLSQLFGRAAELIEKDRLERSGYRKQDEFLERVDPAKPKAPDERLPPVR